MRERVAARVILLDPRGRILLMKGRLPSDPDAPGAWFTVGGGLEPGETVLQAAAREIVEETGFQDAVLGPVVWYSEEILYDRKRRPLVVKQSYVVARCGGGEVSRDGWQPLERELVDDIRWWTLGDLIACPEDVYPVGLAERLPDILDGRYPPEPLILARLGAATPQDFSA